MAYAQAGLNPIGGQSRRGTGIAIWTYITTDTNATVDGAGYFNDAAGLLSVNDIIFVAAKQTSGEIKTFGISIVLSNDGTAVDVGDVGNLVTTYPTDTD
jgi:hypothetical protein